MTSSVSSHQLLIEEVDESRVEQINIVSSMEDKNNPKGFDTYRYPRWVFVCAIRLLWGLKQWFRKTLHSYSFALFSLGLGESMPSRNWSCSTSPTMLGLELWVRWKNISLTWLSKYFTQKWSISFELVGRPMGNTCGPRLVFAIRLESLQLL